MFTWDFTPIAAVKIFSKMQLILVISLFLLLGLITPYIFMESEVKKKKALADSSHSNSKSFLCVCTCLCMCVCANVKLQILLQQSLNSFFF